MSLCQFSVWAGPPCHAAYCENASMARDEAAVIGSAVVESNWIWKGMGCRFISRWRSWTRHRGHRIWNSKTVETLSMAAMVAPPARSDGDEHCRHHYCSSVKMGSLPLPWPKMREKGATVTGVAGSRCRQWR
ncbi:hypothetical protein ACLOJK_037344 [Asimina triloba]